MRFDAGDLAVLGPLVAVAIIVGVSLAVKPSSDGPSEPRPPQCARVVPVPGPSGIMMPLVVPGDCDRERYGVPIGGGE